MNLLDKVLDLYYAVRFKVEDTIDAVKLKFESHKDYGDVSFVEEEPVKKAKKKKAKAKKKKK